MSEIEQSPQMSPQTLIEKAIESNANLETLEKIMSLQERWERSQAEKAFNTAFMQFQKEKPTVLKSKDVYYKDKKSYSFAPLAKIQKQVDPILSKYGLSYSWEQIQAGDVIKIIFVLKHELGHERRTELESKPDISGGKNTIQAIGSGVSYLKRYTLMNGLGVTADDDDDGLSTSLSEEELQEALWHKLSSLYDEKRELVTSEKHRAIYESVIAEQKVNQYTKAIKSLENL